MSRNGKQRLRVMAFAPAFNEKGKIGEALRRIDRRLVEEVLVIDDGSTDGTAGIARKEGATVISNAIRTGVGNCIKQAIKYGLAKSYDVIVIFAGNNKDNPAEMKYLVRPIEEDHFDFVQGSRYLPGGGSGNMPLLRVIATRFVHPLLFSLAVGRPVTDSTNGFRAIRLSVFKDKRVDIDQEWLGEYELEPYTYYKCIKLGYRVKEVPVTKIYPPKELGYTKMKPITGWWSILRPIVLLGLGMRR